jgi:hypothetical protein
MPETAAGRNFAVVHRNVIEQAKKTVRDAGLKNQKTGITSAIHKMFNASGSGEKITRVTGARNLVSIRNRYKIS